MKYEIELNFGLNYLTEVSFTGYYYMTSNMSQFNSNYGYDKFYLDLMKNYFESFRRGAGLIYFKYKNSRFEVPINKILECFVFKDEFYSKIGFYLDGKVEDYFEVSNWLEDGF